MPVTESLGISDGSLAAWVKEAEAAGEPGAVDANERAECQIQATSSTRAIATMAIAKPAETTTAPKTPSRARRPTFPTAVPLPSVAVVPLSCAHWSAPETSGGLRRLGSQRERASALGSARSGRNRYCGKRLSLLREQDRPGVPPRMSRARLGGYHPVTRAGIDAETKRHPSNSTRLGGSDDTTTAD